VGTSTKWRYPQIGSLRSDIIPPFAAKTNQSLLILKMLRNLKLLFYKNSIYRREPRFYHLSPSPKEVFMLIRILFFTCLFFSTQGYAEEKTTLKVKGMHCGSCVKALTKKVCKEQALDNCEVSLTDRKNEMGEISFSKKEGLDMTKIKTIIEDSGYKLAE
jgi:copper chaperone CopZ